MEIDLTAYLESGTLEAFVLGILSEEQTAEVKMLAEKHIEVQEAINEISLALENYLLNQQEIVQPSPTVKPFLMAIIDYTERLTNGEPQEAPPILHQHSTIADYEQWLNRQDMVLPDNFEHFFAKIIGYTPQATTAIAWIKEMAPGEEHTDEHEKFLIVEGTCDFTIGEKVHQLVPGDVLFIPLHTNHHFKVTSSIPCKVILQRVAA